MRRRLQYAMQSLDGCARRLVHPAERLRRSRESLTQLRTRLAFALGHRVHRCAAQLERLQASLAGLDPTAVLGRGYSITRNAAGEVLREASQAREGERLFTTLAHGSLQSKEEARAPIIARMAHRLSKITTRTGDRGETGLGDGSRVSKDSLRVRTLGDQ